MESQRHANGVRTRLAHELKAFAGLSLYLYVCLGAILLYRAAVAGEHRYGALPYGTAAIKALVLAKFVLIGEAARLGERLQSRRLAVAVLQRSVLFLLLLVALTAVEDVVAGQLHGRSAGQALAETLAGRQWEIAASCLLLWLVLLPYIAMQHLRAAMGADAWRRIVFGRGEASDSAGRRPG
ncbi:hypothetical protein [Neoroseomonas soli]|uniref:Uncharacterized protein n=1 Tax=Neoroseomonas soli TaxID=1081025 RepID=A0A9X9WW37_9PROT|nr:hypothetical protein [Neoroseomonas soli]MBR0671366.1 hypothetical protein [Neoroseomonas soli]